MSSLLETKVINMLAVWKWGVATGISVLTSINGTWTALSGTIRVLVTLMALDFFTGLAGAFVLKKINSDVSLRGLVKKVMMFVMIYAMRLISTPLHVGFDLGELLALVFVVGEAISVTENCAQVGVPIPPIIMQTLSKARTLVASPPDTVVTTIQTSETVRIPPAKKKPELQ